MLPIVRVGLAVALAALFQSPVQAQTYPSRTVKIVVPYAAGGPADIYSRVLALHLSKALNQTFVVEDRPGAGSIIGTDAVAKSPPDGYTLLAMSNTHTTNETLVAKKPFQLMRDFVPVATVNFSATSPESLEKSADDAARLLRRLRKHDGSHPPYLP